MDREISILSFDEKLAWEDVLRPNWTHSSSFPQPNEPHLRQMSPRLFFTALTSRLNSRGARWSAFFVNEFN
jgi:hypothetical protein